MPTFQIPQSDKGLRVMLERVVTTGRQDWAAQRGLIDPTMLTDIETFLADWSPKLDRLGALRGGRNKEVRESGTAVKELAVYVRDAWVVQKRRIARLHLPRAILAYYGLPIEGTLPKSVSRDEWLAWAQKLIHGDAAAVADGYPALVNPSAAEVAAQLALAEKEVDEIAMADRVLDNAQEAVAAGRKIARGLIKEAVAQLRFALRKESPESARRVMRWYGAMFRSTRQPIEPETPAQTDQA